MGRCLLVNVLFLGLPISPEFSIEENECGPYGGGRINRNSMGDSIIKRDVDFSDDYNLPKLLYIVLRFI